MTVPTEAEIKKKKQKLEQLKKKLDDSGKTPEKVIVSTIRGAIRRSWMRFPTKLALLEMNCIPDMREETKTKWLYRCAHCDGLFKAADIEVDHKMGENPCNTLEDVAQYARSLLGVSWDDLQILCKPCHLVKTYQERYAVSEEDARIMLLASPIIKLKAPQVKAWLEGKGVVPATTVDKRKLQILEVFRKELNGKE